MKKMLFAIAVLAVMSFAKEETHNADIKASTIEWLGKKTTGQHGGMVAVKSGNLKLANGAPLSGEFVLDMTSISVTDIKDPDDNKSLVDHLKEDDFFCVQKFPTAVLTAKKFEKLATATAEANYNVTADLTIKGVKNEIQFPALITTKGNTTNANAAIKIDRTKWNITYKSKTVLGNMADKFIYDDIEFTVKLVLKK
jgi:polyisoprenoid-binding protein YceI